MGNIATSRGSVPIISKFPKYWKMKCSDLENSNNYLNEENDSSLVEKHRSFTRDISKGLSNTDIAAKFCYF